MVQPCHEGVCCAHYSSFVYEPAVETGMMGEVHDDSQRVCTMEGCHGKNCVNWSRERRFYTEFV